jgi:DNA polymerase-3 subunit beta
MSLNGACLHAEGDKLVMIATDGHKLGRAVIDHEVSEGTEVILPSKVIGQILKSVPADSDIDMVLGERFVSFSAEGLKLISKLIEGPYPRYQNVVPLQFEKEVVFDRNLLLEVVERVGVMTNPRTKQIAMDFDTSTVKINAANQERGNECEEFVECTYTGEAGFRIGVNSSFLSIILRKCGSDRIRIKMNGALGATVIEAEGQEGEYYFLLMPLRLND